ncbi:MAG: hypothetical protein ABSD11_13465 [Methylocella sp.]|jgi:hypothetical protein
MISSSNSSPYFEMRLLGRDLRAELAQAIERRDVALKARDKVADSLQDAQSSIQSIEAELRALDHLEYKITASLARDGALFALEMTPQHAMLIKGQTDASNKLATTRQAHARLQQEFAAADQNLANENQTVRDCAKAVMNIEAERLGAEVARCDEVAAAMRAQLMAYTAPGGASLRFRASARLIAMLRDQPANVVICSCDHHGVQRWDAWLRRLMENSEARPDE